MMWEGGFRVVNMVREGIVKICTFSLQICLPIHVDAENIQCVVYGAFTLAYAQAQTICA